MNLKLIQKLCTLKKDNLRKLLIKYLYSKGYKTVIQKQNMYLFAEGELPICLIAHMDTVFHTSPSQFFYDPDKQILWSPDGAGFDDRTGVYAILSILEAGYKPSIIFTDQEEKGGIGAHSLINNYPEGCFKDCRALIELDRANEKDCIFYDCDNEDFEKYISSFGFELNWGTFSDISIIAPAWGIAAVNLSVGYYLEHTRSEYLKCDELDKTIEKVKKILDKSKDMSSYSYIPYIYSKNNTYNDIWNNFNYSLPAPEKCCICDLPIKNNINKTFCYISDTEVVCEDCFNKYYSPEAMMDLKV